PLRSHARLHSPPSASLIRPPSREPVTSRPPAAPAREAVTSRPPAAPARRHVSAAIRREVWARDAGRCAYTDHRGRRCPETGGLELHHREAHALGGTDKIGRAHV